MQILSVPAALLLLLASAVTAAPLLDERASCVYSCGSVCYWQADIDAALAKGYSMYQSGDTAGALPPPLPSPQTQRS